MAEHDAGAPAGILAGMILAGIDEAGYGPVLGPLVVGCCAFELPDDARPEVEIPAPSVRNGEFPCLWKRLRRVVSKSRDKKGKKLHINDSKLVYSPAAGLKELERSILCLAAARFGQPMEQLEQLLALLCPDIIPELSGYPWYAPFAAELFPLEVEGVGVRLMANAARAEFDRCAVRCVKLSARVVLERRLNQMLDQTRNKSSVLFSTTAIHLDELFREFGDRNLLVFCDRQGGREHYGHLLRTMFEEWSLEIVDEKDGRCEYALHRGGRTVRLFFREKAETHCMSVAVASMVSKYVREALMHRFNAYWRGLLPELQPTAGYYSDGVRFLSDIEQKRSEMGITDADLIRSR